MAEQNKLVISQRKEVNKEMTNIKQKYRVKLVRQKEKRQSITISKLKNDCSDKKSYLDKLENRISSLSDELAACKKALRAACRDRDALAEQLKNQKASNKLLILQLKDAAVASEYLEAQLEDKAGSEEASINTKNGKSYIPPVHDCVYKGLAYNVPVKKIGPFLAFSEETLTGQRLSHVLSPSTCAHMAFELGLLSSIQLVEI